MQHASEELRRIARQFFAGERETYATVLVGILLKVYGQEFLSWDPATIESQIKDDFGAVMPEVVYDQLMALINTMTTDTVYMSLPVFDQTINAFCRTGLHGDHDAPSPHEVAWTVFEVQINDPDPYGLGQKSASPWSHDIATYVGVVLADAGLKRKPDCLSFATMPTWIPQGLNDDPQMFGAAFQSEQDLTAEVDRFVEGQVSALLDHLAEVGIEPAPLLQELSDDLPEESPLDRLLPRGNGSTR